MTLLPFRRWNPGYNTQTDMFLEIPQLHVKVPIVGVPGSETGWDVSWLGDRAGYLEGSAFPTLPGNSIIGGHVYLSNGLAGPFLHLEELKWGDLFTVHAFGQDYIYEVREERIIAPDNTAALMMHETHPWITLFTCKEYDSKRDIYLARIIVRAVLVEIQ